MSETHPNAFRLQASELRAEALRLNGEADKLEAQAEALDPTPKKATKEDVKEHADEELAEVTPVKSKKVELPPVEPTKIDVKDEE